MTFSLIKEELSDPRIIPGLDAKEELCEDGPTLRE